MWVGGSFCIPVILVLKLMGILKISLYSEHFQHFVALRGAKEQKLL